MLLEGTRNALGAGVAIQFYVDQPMRSQLACIVTTGEVQGYLKSTLRLHGAAESPLYTSKLSRISTSNIWCTKGMMLWTPQTTAVESLWHDSFSLNLQEKKQLNNQSFEEGPFKIWCDGFRPANVLLKENLQIASVVDWEFTYAAPIDFSHAPPWWLLIEKPEF